MGAFGFRAEVPNFMSYTLLALIDWSINQKAPREKA